MTKKPRRESVRIRGAVPLVPTPCPEGERRGGEIRVAVRSALVGFVLIMSPFAVACFVSTVPGDHGDGGDSLSWMVAGYLIMITPIGLICVGFAGILLIIRALLR